MAKLSSTQIYGDLQVDGEIKNKASIISEGVVQLNDTIDNDSIVQGATANAVKKVNDLVSTHKTDTTSHITASERTTWNNKAEGSHGNHVPTTQTANNTVFLRNDNTWQTVTPTNIGAFGKQGQISATTNWDDIKTPGSYKVQIGAWGDVSLGAPNNFSSSIYAYGILNVYQSLVVDESRTVQIYFPHRTDNASPILTRMLNGSTWNSWSKVGRGLTASDVGASPSNHTHDDRYYTETEVNSLLGEKANSTHTHTKSQITDFPTIPTSLPANGGNADTVDGYHASSFATTSHTHTKSQITDFPTIPTSLPANGGNADTVGGFNSSGIAKQYVTVNSANISDTNAKEFYGTCVNQNVSAPNTDWWHIINVPHSDNNGYGGQLAIGYHGNASLMVRSAIGTSWGAWYDIVGNIESLKSSVSNGKSAIATAITGKGVSATGSDDFSTLVNKINSITNLKFGTVSSFPATVSLAKLSSRLASREITGGDVANYNIGNYLFSVFSFASVSGGSSSTSFTFTINCKDGLLTAMKSTTKVLTSSDSLTITATKADVGSFGVLILNPNKSVITVTAKKPTDVTTYDLATDVYM